MTRALNHPRPARVRWGDGYPARVDGEAIESLRESWLVEDRWWTDTPLRRRYWELVGARGRNVVIFHDLTVTARARARGRSGGAGAGSAGHDAVDGWFVQSSQG